MGTDTVAAVIGGLITVVPSLLTGFIIYGTLREKVAKLEREAEANSGRFVDFRYFDSVIHPLQSQLSDIQSDLKKVLMLMASNEKNLE